MKTGIAKPERRTGKSLTLPYRTNSVLDAIRAQAVGKPIDVMSGYYGEQGMDISGEFFMLDKLEKHHKIAEFKANKALLEAQVAEQLTQLKQIQDDKAKEAEASAKQSPEPSGAVPQSGGNNQPGGNPVKP